jgi:serine/threonine protein kinase
MGSQCIKRLCKKKKYVNFNINNPDLNSENTLITIKNQNINNSCVSSKKNPSDYSDNTSTLQINNFQILKNLGKGTFGKVVLVRDIQDQRLYAMKILKKKKIKQFNNETHTKAEREILERLSFPFIMKLRYAFQTTERLYLVTDFMQGGEIYTHLKNEGRFEESKAIFYICEIILAIGFLHKNSIIYRDLKPENILLDRDGHIKLTDFGLSKIELSQEDSRCYTMCGTPEYLAPEVVMGKGYDKNIDWWSVGALFFKFLSGVSPVRVNNNNVNITSFKDKIDVPYYFSYEAKSFVEDILKINPQERLGYYGDVEEIKQHTLFSKIDWNNIAQKKVKPPFIPVFSDNSDLKYFDKSFTQKCVYSSFADKNEKETEIDMTYDRFSYNGSEEFKKK